MIHPLLINLIANKETAQHKNQQEQRVPKADDQEHGPDEQSCYRTQKTAAVVFPDIMDYIFKHPSLPLS